MSLLLLTITCDWLYCTFQCFTTSIPVSQYVFLLKHIHSCQLCLHQVFDKHDFFCVCFQLLNWAKWMQLHYIRRCRGAGSMVLLTSSFRPVDITDCAWTIYRTRSSPSHLKTCCSSKWLWVKVKEMTSGGDSTSLGGRLCVGKRAVMMEHGKNSCWEEKLAHQ